MNVLYYACANPTTLFIVIVKKGDLNLKLLQDVKISKRKMSPYKIKLLPHLTCLLQLTSSGKMCISMNMKLTVLTLTPIK